MLEMMTHTLSNTLAKLRALISEEMFPLTDTFSDDCDLYQEGLDSMALMQLILLLEQEFDVRVEPSDLGKENFQSLLAISTLIVQKSADA